MNTDLGMFTVVLLAVALGIDAFSMSIGVGMQQITTLQMGQLTLIVGTLHILLPLLGIYLGQVLGAVAGNIASYIGAGVLIFLGARMIYEEFRGEEEEEIVFSHLQMLVLPISVSLDSLSIGFSLGTFGIQKLVYVTGVFGLVAAAMTAGGVFLGMRIGHVIEKTSILGGSILILLGLKMLFM